VAPFKGQNMSNNARIVDGGEIGVAQYVQALAARVRPDVRMNPVLLKPQAQGSALILSGKPDPELTALPWRLRKPLLWPAVRDALADLRAEHDLVIVEGAGSPSDSYLYHNDIVNMRVAREAQATTVLVTDAGRGGAVAHCYGSWLLLPPAERALVRGWIFNLFYRTGNVALLQPGIDHLQRLTGVPSLGTLPELDHRLPDEDLHSGAAADSGTGRVVAVVRYPQISNFDEFTALDGLAGVRLTWARDAAAVRGADVVVLPGSRHVAADLAWMRQRGIDAAVTEAAAAGRPVLGICGGLQMLGEELTDPDGVEEAAVGLGLLPLRTTMRSAKVQARTSTAFAGELPGVWAPLAGLPVSGYEIRHGRSERTGPVAEILPDGRGFAAGNILAAYLHGMLENPEVVGAIFGVAVDYWAELERSFDAVADAARQHLDLAALTAMLDLS
jgi:adenosylcobyric acid synthase